MRARIFLAPVALLYVAVVVLDRSPSARRSVLVAALSVFGLLAWALAR